MLRHEWVFRHSRNQFLLQVQPPGCPTIPGRNKPFPEVKGVKIGVVNASAPILGFALPSAETGVGITNIKKQMNTAVFIANEIRLNPLPSKSFDG
jgi:hypothetical protein